MTLTGENFIGFQNSAQGEKTFQAFASGTNCFYKAISPLLPRKNLTVLSLAAKLFLFTKTFRQPDVRIF